MTATLQSSCTQEPRITQLETSMASISETLQDVRDLLKASIRSEERIMALQQEGQDKERRIRKLETGHASRMWMDRVVWGIVAAALALLLKQ